MCIKSNFWNTVFPLSCLYMEENNIKIVRTIFDTIVMMEHSQQFIDRMFKAVNTTSDKKQKHNLIIGECEWTGDDYVTKRSPFSL